MKSLKSWFVKEKPRSVGEPNELILPGWLPTIGADP